MTITETEYMLLVSAVITGKLSNPVNASEAQQYGYNNHTLIQEALDDVYDALQGKGIYVRPLFDETP